MRHNGGVIADPSGASAAPPQQWKAALLTIRTQVADYEREGTSTPGKLKRAARLRACRLAVRDTGPEHADDSARLRAALAEIENAEKNDDWRRIGELVRRLLRDVDELIGRKPV